MKASMRTGYSRFHVLQKIHRLQREGTELLAGHISSEDVVAAEKDAEVHANQQERHDLSGVQTARVRRWPRRLASGGR